MKGKRNQAILPGNAGMALMTALIFIIISSLILTSMMARYMQQRLLVDRFEDYYNCFDGAEAAFQQCYLSAMAEGPGIIGLENWTPQFDDGNRLVLPDFDEEDVSPMSLASMPDVEFIGYTLFGRDVNNNGVLEPDIVSIHTAARTRGTRRRLDVVCKRVDVNVWRNAIFAGNGQGGRLINGNVSIHGSVHLLGDDLPAGGLAINAIDLSGTSLISNNYTGMPGDLAQRIPPLLVREYGGEDASTLEAVLRVKQGLVSMSGNSRIGLAQVAGSGVRNPMDAIYVTDGWTGNSVINDGGRGIPTRVWSDNGHENRYDLGDLVPFPTLADDWREPDGSLVMNPDTNSWYTHEDYFTEVLLADPDVKDDGIYNGNITIDARNSPHYYWNATTEEEMTGAEALAATPDADDDFIKYNADTKVFTMNGQIRINGELTFTGQGGDRTIHYSGRAAFLVDGNVNIDANLLSCNNGDPADTTNSFPVNNAIGIMSYHDMIVGESSQLSIMGAFYAEGTIQTRRQTNVLGTFVANYFDMGTNVPNIYQVPTLADNLPYGMIGNYPIIFLQKIAWSEGGIV